MLLYRIVEFALGHAKHLMESAALILSVVNGAVLLRSYLRDKPKLLIEVIHPEVYQWWFPLPGRVRSDGQETRAFGFVAYVGISNSGLRKVQLKSWRLAVRSKRLRKIHLKPINMPEVEIGIGSYRKYLGVLGQQGVHFGGDTLIDSGCSISGTVFFKYECYGDSGWDPPCFNNRIRGDFRITDIFGGKASTTILFTKKTLEEMRVMAPDIGNFEPPSPSKDDVPS